MDTNRWRSRFEIAGDWGFKNNAFVYSPGQVEGEDYPLIAIRGGELSCFKNTKEERKNSEAKKLADFIADACNEKLDREAK